MKKAIRLWERDYRILQDLKYGFCTTNQIAKVYFSSNSKKASERLKLLFKHGYLSRFQKPLLDVRGKPEYVYCKKGRAVRGYAKINHSLAVSEFRVLFALWLRSCPDFSGEFLFPSQLPGSLFDGSLIPDGVCVIEHKGKKRKKLLFFYECDLGTESVAGSSGYSLVDKMSLYAEYFDSGKYGEDFGWLRYPFRGFRVLVVFESEWRRQCFLLSAFDNAFDFVATATFEQLQKEGFGGKIWKNVEGRVESVVGG